MTRPTVWAPIPRRVEVIAAGRRHAMEPLGRGWWEGPDVLVDGVDYGFVLDDSGPLPDPRSPWQPSGVHGLSRWVDHEHFGWSDAGWRPPGFATAVVYELHVGTFSPEGSFDGAIDRLDHLVELGVSHIELMPVAQFPGTRGWGYDGVDLFAPHHALGGPDGLKRLVDTAHGKGLAVLLDVVYNHFGPDGNHLPRFGPYLTDRYRTPWGDAVNLDGAGSDEIRRFFCDNALTWLRDYHLDGLRIDAVHAFVDTSATHFLEQLATEVDDLEDALRVPLTLIAESDLNDPRVVRPRSDHGLGIDASWSDDFHHALHVTLTGERDGYYADFEPFVDLCRSLREVYAYGGRHSRFRHRSHGRPVGDMPRSRFLAYLQDHDQVGNRAQGERSSALMSAEALRVGAALVLLGPYVPMLFQGEEWAASTPFQYFTDHQDPELGRAVSRGRREEFASFGWPADSVPDPQDPATFERSRLDWSELERDPHASILDWHRRLIAARRSIPELAAGPIPEVRSDEAARWLVVERAGTVLAVNLGDAAAAVPLGAGPWHLELGSAAEIRLDADALILHLPPMSAALLIPE
jgi:maltooligosyltrehalose trehalohydrolase